MLSRQDLAEIVERASSLAERLGAGFVVDQAAEDSPLVDARVERWRQLVAGGNRADFERRLALDGLDMGTVRRALGRARLVADHPLPVWATTLGSVLEAAARLEPQPGHPRTARRADADQPTPFEELRPPFVLVARERLRARAGAAEGQLTEAACATLERSLLQRLARLCASPLDLEFSIFRTSRQSSFTRLLGALQENAPCELYGQFIERMLTGGLKGFFREYPVLARLVATLTDFWVDAVAEFLLRLDADRPDLEAAFSAGVGLGRVAIEMGLSDPHIEDDRCWR